MAKTIQEQLAEEEVSPEMNEIYAPFGGLGRVLEPPSSAEARIEQARLHGDAVRESAKLDEQRRARETRREQAARQAEVDAKARVIEDEKAAREFEAELETQLRSEHPRMSNEAWRDIWPSVRREYYAAAHQERMNAIMQDVPVPQL